MVRIRKVFLFLFVFIYKNTCQYLLYLSMPFCVLFFTGTCFFFTCTYISCTFITVHFLPIPFYTCKKFTCTFFAAYQTSFSELVLSFTAYAFQTRRAGCSSVDSVPAFEAVRRRIDPSQWTQLQFGLFSVPTSGPQMVYQRPWYVMFCLWKSAYKRSLAAYRKE